MLNVGVAGYLGLVHDDLEEELEVCLSVVLKLVHRWGGGGTSGDGSRSESFWLAERGESAGSVVIAGGGIAGCAAAKALSLVGMNLILLGNKLGRSRTFILLIGDIGHEIVKERMGCRKQCMRERKNDLDYIINVIYSNSLGGLGRYSVNCSGTRTQP